jgi:hypothetical protein
MTWLALAYMVSIGTMSYQMEYINPPIEAFYLTPQGTFSEKLGVEAQIFDDLVFIGGSVETWESIGGSQGMFSPSQSLYVFNAGVRKNGIEFGWRWECDHMTLPGTQIPNQGFLGNKSEIYFSYHGNAKIF